MKNLPDELLHAIAFTYLKPSEIITLAKCSQQFYRAFYTNQFDIDKIRSLYGLERCIKNQWWGAIKLIISKKTVDYEKICRELIPFDPSDHYLKELIQIFNFVLRKDESMVTVICEMAILANNSTLLEKFIYHPRCDIHKLYHAYMYQLRFNRPYTKKYLQFVLEKMLESEPTDCDCEIHLVDLAIEFINLKILSFFLNNSVKVYYGRLFAYAKANGDVDMREFVEYFNNPRNQMWYDVFTGILDDEGSL